MNLYAKQKYLWLPKEIGGGKGMDWRFGVGTYMHTEVYGMTGQQRYAVQHREFYPIFCDNLSRKRN